jgi:hypothetical protein
LFLEFYFVLVCIGLVYFRFWFLEMLLVVVYWND